MCWGWRSCGGFPLQQSSLPVLRVLGCDQGEDRFQRSATRGRTLGYTDCTSTCPGFFRPVIKADVSSSCMWTRLRTTSG
eukprot:3017242-Rhodomonas_salina.1